ncbi:MAG: phenylacetate-CoA oxygenase subunit PaaJ [Bacteroidetes bacterium]|nr:MAG: phenylacetate-CoA oxygenase subunit PaaJ [Bacteroidota bacterium]GIV57210.1 MAG: phenylacetate-CoA oxygenase subunit PaaJ [Rhodothermaceae bacterium]
MDVTKDDILALLSEVKDPEIPVLDVVEMGIVRDVRLEGDTLHVDITPTYSGCPAMQTITEEITRTLRARGFPKVEVHTVFREAWTTDWMTEAAREKLRAYGIAPPPPVEETHPGLIPLTTIATPKPVPCPFCGSEDTRLTSAFGATACKSLHYCNACQQPFEHFKAL